MYVREMQFFINEEINNVFYLDTLIKIENKAEL